jgi:hypothetical protein
VKAPGAVEVGRRVYIRAPTARDRDDFLAPTRPSRGAFQSAYLGFYAGAPFMGKGYMSEGLRRAGFRREGFSTSIVEDVRR